LNATTTNPAGCIGAGCDCECHRGPSYPVFRADPCPRCNLAQTPDALRAENARLAQLVCDFQAAAMLDVGNQGGPCCVEPKHVAAHVEGLHRLLDVVNAVLIQAAPDLLAACVEAEAVLAKLDTLRHLSAEFSGLDRLRAVIEKATTIPQNAGYGTRQGGDWRTDEALNGRR
jgi:hypothetical protein